MKSWLALAALAVCTVPAYAVPITVNFDKAILPGPFEVPLPFLTNGVDSPVFLRFKVPDAPQIVSINSITVTVRVYDDGEERSESGEILFATPGPNLYLDGFANLFGVTAAEPTILTHSLTPDEISFVAPTVLDGTFRIRVNRSSGDFYIMDGSVEMDAELAPEPASMAGAASGIVAVAALAVRRRRRS